MASQVLRASKCNAGHGRQGGISVRTARPQLSKRRSFFALVSQASPPNICDPTLTFPGVRSVSSSTASLQGLIGAGERGSASAIVSSSSQHRWNLMLAPIMEETQTLWLASFDLEAPGDVEGCLIRRFYGHPDRNLPGLCRSLSWEADRKSITLGSTRVFPVVAV